MTFPPEPIKGYMPIGPQFEKGFVGWKVYAEPGQGRVPVTIVPGHHGEGGGEPQHRQPTVGASNQQEVPEPV